MKVLITGCGRHSKTLVECLKNNPDGIPVEIISINNSERNILRTGVDECYIAPSIFDEGYIDWLRKLCEDRGVDVILPYITAELPIAAANRAYLESKGTKVSVASLDSLIIANNKVEMAKRFPQYMPKQIVAHNSRDIRTFAKKVGYHTGTPLCCKLTDKCGGAGFAILDERKYLDIASFNKVGVNRYISLNQLCEIADKVDTEIIIQEYVAGTDYSVCVLADNGNTLYECGFAGYAMEFGAVTSGEIIKNEEAYRIAREVVEELGLDGNCCFDFIIKADGSPVLLECNPRINATLPFLAKAGADLAYYRCRQLLGLDLPETLEIDYGLKMVKYYESHYFK